MDLFITRIITARIRRMGKVIVSILFDSPHPEGGGGGCYPMTGYLPSQVRMGTPSQGWGPPTPIQGWGSPLPRDRTTDGELDMRLAVCLLRSRRRTFLFSYSKEPTSSYLPYLGTRNSYFYFLRKLISEIFKKVVE